MGPSYRAGCYPRREHAYRSEFFSGRGFRGTFLAPHTHSIGFLIVGGFFGFDLLGGAVASATDTTKRWYHRPGVGVRQYLAFISLHLAHVAVLAWLFRDGDVWFLALFGFTLLAATGVVLAVPVYLKRAVAAELYLGAVVLGLYAVTPTAGLELFIPALFLKLLVGHLVPERARDGRVGVNSRHKH